jgi:glycosyltransferase 2 family protein
MKDGHPPRAVDFLKKHAYLAAAGLLLAALIYFWLRHAGDFDWVRFRANFAQADALWITASCLLISLSYIGRAIRWQLMLRPIAPRSEFGRLLAATVVGFTATVFFGRAGEFVRPYLIARKEGVSISSQIAVWLAERIFDLLMVLLLFGFALSQLEKGAAHITPRVATILEGGGWALGFLSLVCLIAITSFRFFHDGLRDRLLDGLGFLPQPALEKATRFLDSFGEGMLATRNPRSLTLLFVYSVVEWIVLILVGYCVMHALPGTRQLTLHDTMIVLGFVAFGGSVQLPGIGGGSQMATIFTLTELYGISAEAAGGAAVLLWLVNLVIVVPFGVVLALHDGLKWNEMKNAVRDLEPPTSTS